MTARDQRIINSLDFDKHIKTEAKEAEGVVCESLQRRYHQKNSTINWSMLGSETHIYSSVPKEPG